MKIALPLTASEEFSPHYGASSKFIVYDVDLVNRAVRRRMLVDPQASEPCEWPQLLRAAGVDLVLAGGIGPGAQKSMAAHGVKVVTGAPVAAPGEIVAGWIEGKWAAGVNTCDGSGRHHSAHTHHSESGDAHAHGGCNCSH